MGRRDATQGGHNLTWVINLHHWLELYSIHGSRLTLYKTKNLGEEELATRNT